MATQDWGRLSSELSDALGIDVPPIAITFLSYIPEEIAAFDAPMPPPTPDGRTGRVPAGCVFWMLSTHRTFTTLPQDHFNCSVGSLTHGLKKLEEVARNSDVAELLDCGWVTLDVVQQIPTVNERPASIVYGPLSQATLEPDVVLLRISARQLMVLSEALPDLRIEGKPQCHIVAIAKDQAEVVASVGCQLSRVRTGMSNSEMTCAIPANRLAEIVDRLHATARADNAVARYAAEDSRRFSTLEP